MAKKSTKKSSPKRTSKKSSPSKALEKKKTTSRSRTVKAVKKTVATRKTSTAKTANVAKKTSKKSTDKKQKQKKTMPRKTRKKVEEKVEMASVQVEIPSEPLPKPIESIKGYSKKDLDHFKQIILEKRDEIIDQLQNLKDQMLDPTTGEYINENSPYSLHMAEQGTDAMEREKTFLYAQRENKFLGYLEDALKRIDAGTYGICIECIDEPQHLCETCPLIPKARLEAVPHSQLCLPIKQRQEKR